MATNDDGSSLETATMQPLVTLATPWHEPFLEPDSQPSILILDQADVNRRLLRATLKAEPCRILEARRAPEALALLAREKVDLVILDLMMPSMSGPDFCRTLKADRKTQLIPILMLTSIQGVENEVASIASGADEFLIKPLHPAVVRTRIRAMLRNKAAIDSLEEVESILFALALAVEHRDKYTAGHCQRLAWYSVSLGTAMGLPRHQLLALHRGGFLHDIGKITVPDAVLYKNGRLDEEEWVVMRSHPVKGEDICRPMKSLRGVLPIIRSHHERWDGGGYPDHLRGEEIPLVARVLQVADIYDALTTVRPYKPAFTPDQAFEILEEESVRGWRDPQSVAAFRLLHSKGQVLAADAPLLSWPQLELMRQSIADASPLAAN